MMERRGVQARRIRRLMLGVVASVLLTVALGGYWFVQVVAELGVEARQERVQLLALEDAVSDAMAELSGQTQEWKDMLLRGYDPALRDQHHQAFEAHAQSVQAELADAQQAAHALGLDAADIATFARQHRQLMSEYHAALTLFEPKNPLSYRLVDGAVRGRDRLLRDGLRHEREKLEAQISEHEKNLGTGGLGQYGLKLGGLAVLLPLLSLWGFWRVYRALKEIGRSDARIRAIYQSIGDAVLVADMQGRVQSLNATAQTLLGWREAEAQGKPVHEVFELYDARHQQRVESPAEIVLRDGCPIPMSNGMLLRRRDGTERAVEDSAAPVLDEQGGAVGVVMVFHDVSRRYALMKELSRERELFQQTFDLAAVGMAHLGMDGKWLRVNRKLCEITGYSEAELLAMSFQGITHPDDMQRDLDKLHDLLSAHIVSYHSEKRYLHKDGHSVWVALTVSIVWKADGTPDFGVSVIEDIQARKDAEAASAASAAQFQSLFEQMPEGVVLFDEQLRVILHNHEAARLLEYRSEELLGLHVADIEAMDDRDAIAVRQENLRRTGRDDFASRYRTQSGRLLEVDVSVQWVQLPDGRRAFQTLFHDITAQKQAAAEIEHLAYHDPLTGLANRSLLQDRLTQAISSALRRDAKLAVIYLDLDHFKDVNDSLGHKTGDALLQVVAGRLLGCIRTDDTLARMGGDEFVLMLNGLKDADDVASIAEKVIRELALPVTIDENELHVTPSMGISLCPQDGRDAGDLLKYADAALYQAKQQGRATYRFYTQALHEQSLERVQMERLLRHALQRDQFELYYQPQVDLATGQIIGCEALIRWNPPGLGQVSPARFIPVAEHSGLINEIGIWVMHEACRQAKRWHDQGRELKVSFNVSPRQFMRPAELLQALRHALAVSGVDAARMEVELTESLLLDSGGMGEVLHEIRALGLHLVLDDFGTGYSSLSYLRRFPISVLKIDQSFVSDADNNPDDAEMVKTIIGMAHNLRMTLVAEGIETDAQRQMLAAQGCEVGQGYYYSRPVPVAAFDALLQNQAAAV